MCDDMETSNLFSDGISSSGVIPPILEHVDAFSVLSVCGQHIFHTFIYPKNTSFPISLCLVQCSPLLFLYPTSGESQRRRNILQTGPALVYHFQDNFMWRWEDNLVVNDENLDIVQDWWWRGL